MRGGSGKFYYSVYCLSSSSLWNSEQSESRQAKFLPFKSFLVVVVVVVVACLIIVSTSGPDLSRFRLGLVRLVTRSVKARFGQVGDHVSQVKARARSLTILIKVKTKLYKPSGPLHSCPYRLCRHLYFHFFHTILLSASCWWASSAWNYRIQIWYILQSRIVDSMPLWSRSLGLVQHRLVCHQTIGY